MLKYLLLLCVSSFCFAQVQSLAEYNRSLLSQLAQKKTLSSKEFKTLRIRLGTEMTSADDSSYKEGELLKLLEYASYSAYLSKNREEEKIVKDMWGRYLALPNTTSKTFEPSYILDVLAEASKNPDNVVTTLEYYTRFITKDQHRKFFLPLVETKCKTYMYLRKNSEVEKCFAQAAEYSDNTAKEKAEFKTVQINYYFELPYLKKEGYRIAKEIIADESLKSIHVAAKRQRLLVRLYEGDVKDIDADLDKIRRDDKDTGSYERLLLKSHLVRNQLDKALAVFKNIVERNMNGLQLFRYYRLAAELFFRKGEYQKAEFYLNKMLELEQQELSQIEIYLSKAIIAVMAKTYSNTERLKPQFETFATLAKDYKLEDPQYLSSIKVGQLLTATTKVDPVELSKALVEFKKYEYPYSINVVMLEKLVADLMEKKNEIITK